ncbi:MAG: MFS transporter [Trueperaceae bacterium]
MPHEPPTDPGVEPRPEAPARSRVVASSPVYYGWVILLVGTFGLMMTTPGQTLGVSVFLDKIIEDLGTSRSVVSLLYTVGTMIAAFALPFIGRFIDIRGPRLAVAVITVAFAAACVWMGFVTGPVMLLLGFVLIRMLGQGALSLVSQYVINVWFVRRRGLAVGLSGLGMATATALFPRLIESLIVALDWRLAYAALGGLVLVTMLPIGIGFYRSRPETFGLEADVGPLRRAEALRTTGHAESHRPTIVEANYTLKQARKTVTFWLFATGNFLVEALGTGLLFHHYSIMQAGGLERDAAATVFVTLGFAAAAGNMVTGVLMDRVPPRYLLSVLLALQAAVLVLATRITGIQALLLYGTLLGLMQGMNGAIAGSVHAHYFGRAHIGSIKGFAATLSVAGTAVGPLLFALGLDLGGSYAPVLVLSALPPFALALVTPFFRPFRGPGVVA